MSDNKEQKGQSPLKNALQSSINPSEKEGPIDFYKKDKKFVFVYKKTEKLVSAIFLLTSFFAEDEPLRSELRLSAVRLLDSELDLVEGVGTNSVASHDRLRKNALHIVSLLQAGFYAGLISEMNFDVLRQEFVQLLDKLSETPKENEKQTIFPNSFFDISQDYESAGDTPQDTRPESHNKPPVREHAPSPSRQSTDTASALRPVQAYKTSKGQAQGQGVTGAKKTDRQEVIVDIIRRKKKVSIKDISTEIHGCSEKTIQRELGALVEKGILNKEGERRWSRYMLAA